MRCGKLRVVGRLENGVFLGREKSWTRWRPVRGKISYRAKGTEMFWNDPQGAEAILRVRAASWSDDDRMSRHMRQRLGQPFRRRPKRCPTL
jgi:hypothetical protein